jgi:uncharacterized protein YoxC
MDVNAAVTLIVPTLSAVTGLVSALAALNASRKDLRKIAAEAVRTGITAKPGVTTLAVELAMELAAARAELAGRKGGRHYG